LEKIDGEADLFGIDFVKVSSVEAAEKYGILNVPSLVYFRKKTPLIYDGDLTQEEKILQWLTSQDVFEIKNEIEEVNKKMLDKLLDENEYLAVFFCKGKDKIAFLILYYVFCILPLFDKKINITHAYSKIHIYRRTRHKGKRRS
jgi:hypothetical protein